MTLAMFMFPFVSEAAWWNPLDWINYFVHRPVTSTLTIPVAPSNTTSVVSNVANINISSTTKNINTVNVSKNATSTSSVLAAVVQPKKFYSTAGKFAINFSGQPTTATTSIYIGSGPTPGYLYFYLNTVSGQLANVLAAMYFELPNQLTFNDSPTGTISGSLSGIMASLVSDQMTTNSAKLVSSQVGSYGGYLSDDYLLYQTSKNLYMKGRIVLSTSKAYILYADYKDDANSAQNSNVADKFFNSLVITP